MEGKVKWFSNQKGMGYISVEGKKGPCAANVTIKERNTQKRHNDDRVSCPKCHKKIVPRLVIQSGQPQRSLCRSCELIKT